MRALLVPIGDEWYAYELASVREVVPRPVLTALPEAPPAVLGVFNLRGEVVPALDTAALLGLGGLGAAAYVAVVDTDGGPAGLAASGSPRAAELGDPAGPGELPGTLGRYTVDGGVATLVDPLALATAERIGGAAP